MSDAIMQLDRIRQKLRDKGVRVNDPVSEEWVAVFESWLGLQLPSGYRSFITQVGDGGFGPPAYGLLRLGDMHAEVLSKEPSDTCFAHVLRPFPFTRGWVWEGEAGETSTEGSKEQLEFGSIPLGDDGCGGSWHLVVNGPCRGIPWLHADVGVSPVLPKRDFLQWYEDWLDGRDSFYGWDEGMT